MNERKDKSEKVMLVILALVVALFVYWLVTGHVLAHGKNEENVSGNECEQGVYLFNPHCTLSITPSVTLTDTPSITPTDTPIATVSPTLTPSTSVNSSGDGKGDGKSDGRSDDLCSKPPCVSENTLPEAPPNTGF